MSFGKDYFNKKEDVKMQPIAMPRARGNAIELPNGRWGYELMIQIGQTDPSYFGTKDEFEGYETKAEAIKNLKLLATDVLRAICLEIGVSPEGWLDLNKNEIVKELVDESEIKK